MDDFGCYRVRLAISEAVANAIQHGSPSPDDGVEIFSQQESAEIVWVQVRKLSDEREVLFGRGRWRLFGEL